METLPHPIIALPNIASRYDKTDASRATVDEAASNAYDEGVAPLRKARATFAKLANRYSLTHKPKDAQAFGDYIETWAKADALTGFFNHGNTPQDKHNHSAQQFNLSLTLSSLGMSYAQVRDALPASQQTTIDAWLKKVDATLEEPEAAKTKPNNHAYWRGAAHTAIGHATHDKTLLTKGINTARQGIAQIDSDLLFPAEAQRGNRSLDYQFFAAMPLTLTAEIAQANGIYLYQDNNHALRRVIEERLIPTLEGDTSAAHLLEARTDAVQLPPKPSNMPLFALYNNRFPSPRTETAVNHYLSHRHTHPLSTEAEEPFSISAKNTAATLHTLSHPSYGGHVDTVFTSLHREALANTQNPAMSSPSQPTTTRHPNATGTPSWTK